MNDDDDDEAGMGNERDMWRNFIWGKHSTLQLAELEETDIFKINDDDRVRPDIGMAGPMVK